MTEFKKGDIVTVIDEDPKTYFLVGDISEKDTNKAKIFDMNGGFCGYRKFQYLDLVDREDIVERVGFIEEELRILKEFLATHKGI